LFVAEDELHWIKALEAATFQQIDNDIIHRWQVQFKVRKKER